MIQVAAALVILVLSVTLKWWSTFQLWHRYQPSDYWDDQRARRLFLLGKISPLTACGAVVALAYATSLWWFIVPAWLFFVILAYGVVWRINLARRRSFRP
jgi:hypothetical protein